ncbi:hypothetical protein ILUMI_17836 [Ignelater luminosus]|uniref:DUF7041 domain-containing protein n=1 Tax=Ignelater luminosus TaxID=2038154 RepID=A0A8K0CQB0_IGNLU|nr:hypothetical protein ILUMI_17836 [Ignelater luminosus]
MQDFTKYGYMVRQLDNQTLEVIEDVIVSPPTAGRYEKIKNKLIKRLSASQEQRLRQLESQPSTDLIKSLWLNRHPTTLQAILAVSTETSLDKLDELADKINKSTPRRQVASVSSSNSELKIIRKQPPELDVQVASLTHF